MRCEPAIGKFKPTVPTLDAGSQRFPWMPISDYQTELCDIKGDYLCRIVPYFAFLNP